MACLRGKRVVEARAWRRMERAALQALDEQIGDAVRRADGPILYADYRHASPVVPAVGRQWSRAMRRANGRVLRTGILVDPANILFNLQLYRWVECTHNPARRVFADRNELFAWLAIGCSEQEQRVLRDILGEPDPSGST
ncbi:MAG TPA: hypothetical protein VEK07_21035 [Polyangiaceae bacterium]|nr:hypothetical protein [Polyangiaceae bacterium]